MTTPASAPTQAPPGGDPRANPLLLRNWPVLGKVGLLAIVLVFGMGLAASLQHIVNHYQNRDERPGLTRDDIVAAYSGLRAPARIGAVVDAPKHAGVDLRLSPEDRATLTKWLAAERVAENYDNIDFADPTPRDVLAASCLKCHHPGSTDEKARLMPLQTWDQVKPFAFERRVERTPDKVKAISTHTHALSLATMIAIIAVLAMLTGWPRWLVGGLLCVAGAGLALDIASWWLTNHDARWVTGIIAGGAAFNGATALMLGMIAIDAIRPRFKA